MTRKRNLLAAAMVGTLTLPGCVLHGQSTSRVKSSPPPTLASTIFGSSTKAPTALPFVSTIFGDNMVLQRGKPDTTWG